MALAYLARSQWPILQKADDSKICNGAFAKFLDSLGCYGELEDTADGDNFDAICLITTTGWCNGNTRDFGSLIQGSNPCPVAAWSVVTCPLSVVGAAG
jgi:hypothetical protein